MCKTIANTLYIFFYISMYKYNYSGVYPDSARKKENKVPAHMQIRG